MRGVCLALCERLGQAAFAGGHFFQQDRAGGWGGKLRGAPEQGKSLVEERQLLARADHHRAQRIMHAVAVGNIDQGQGLDGGQTLRGADAQADPPQQAGKMQHILREHHGARRASLFAWATRAASPAACRAVMSSWYLSSTPSVSSTISGAQLALIQSRQGQRPVDRLRDAGRLEHIRAAHALHEGDHLGGELCGEMRGLDAQNRRLARRVGIVHPMIQAAAADRVMHLAGTVGGEHHHRLFLRPHHAELRDAELEVAEQLEQEGLERLIGAVQLVDQQHRRRQIRIDGGEQRAAEQKFAAIDAGGKLCAPAGRLAQADRHQLAGMVPFIGGSGEVQPVIALQPHQAPAKPGGENLGDLGLAGAGLAFKEERALHGERQMHRGGELPVGDIALGGQQRGGLGDGGHD